MSSGYGFKIDIVLEIGKENVAYYHSLVGVLRWIVELGKVDINAGVSMLFSILIVAYRIVCVWYFCMLQLTVL